MKDYSVFVHTAVLKDPGSYREFSLNYLIGQHLYLIGYGQLFLTMSRMKNFGLDWLNRKTHIQHFCNRAKFGWQCHGVMLSFTVSQQFNI